MPFLLSTYLIYFLRKFVCISRSVFSGYILEFTWISYFFLAISASYFFFVWSFLHLLRVTRSRFERAPNKATPK